MLAGASIAIGLPLIRELVAASHEVVGIHRSPQGRDGLLATGATPVRVDVLERRTLLTALDGQRRDAVVAELTAMKKAPLT